MVAGARRIRSKKLREDRYREGYATRSLEGKRVEGDGDHVEYMWEEVKWVMVQSARGGCRSVTVGGKNSKSVWLNDEIKAGVKRKEAIWKVLAASDEEANEKCM